MDMNNSVVRADPRRIPATLKEAVVDGLLNSLVQRLSGIGPHGAAVFGTRPRNALVCAFLLPQPKDTAPDSDEVTASIRITGHGLDLLIGKEARGIIRVQPHASLYVRVFPTAEEMKSHPNCDPKFILRRDIERRRRELTRDRIREALKTMRAGRKDPSWPECELQIRKEVHAELGIPFGSGTEEATGDTAGILSDTEPAETDAPTTAFSGRTNLPDDLANEASVPQKWRRLEVNLPLLELRLDAIDESVRGANSAMSEAIDGQLRRWAEDTDVDTGGRVHGYRHASTIRPSDLLRWSEYLARIWHRPVVLPKINLEWDVETSPDFLYPDCEAIHIALENRSTDPPGGDTEPAAFQVSLDVLVPKQMHRPLMLDRVKPSYRYYQHMAYPALGFNGGVEVGHSGEDVVLTTTWSPAFHQPRIVPRPLAGVVTNMAALAQPDSVDGLMPLVTEYQTWLAETRKHPFSMGLDPQQDDLFARERAKFTEDLGRWQAELVAIRTGISILARSRQEWSRPGPQAAAAAAPFEAWLAMNEAMSRVAAARGYTDWRPFQLAFILANLPALVTRLPEFHDLYTEEVGRQANAVTLLYFATGGGKSEAFFGLLVFALFLDRLRGKERGVTALVRYPLRLLTLQQAKRMAMTLAQAEIVRRIRAHPGDPFSIGFWVGSSNTPNSLRDEDVRALPEIKKHPPSAEPALLKTTAYVRAIEKWNKLPKCPYCGGPTGLRRFSSLGGMVGHLCLTDACSWHSASHEVTPLPFYIVDDDIYDFAPTVLLGTVDKLALLGQSQRTIRRFLGMFGFAPGYKPDTGRLYLPEHRSLDELSMPKEERPFRGLFPAYADGDKRYFDPFPALLIQDEAHLLDESLGTFAGLFETAMDTALDQLSPLLQGCIAVEPGSNQRRRTKVIAASATVTDPERQMRNIYQRSNTLQFPYPGPDLYTSFYAHPLTRSAGDLAFLPEASDDVEGRSQWARVYRSILTNGHTHTVTVVETLAHFHALITQFFEAFRSGHPGRVADGKEALAGALSRNSLTPVLRQALHDAGPAALATLLDLHRIALTYVTNKKGGDQIIAAESIEFAKKHLAVGLDGYRLDTDLVTGAVDAGHIQAVIDRAEYRPPIGAPFDELNGTLRSIVATSAVSHGVDVEELNSMFFAGMPSDIAEYIQASSRVGRTHVGFCILVPTPQRARDRYIVEVHDIFHRFLERMIVPAAIDRWAERAIERVVASFLQTCLCGVRAIQAVAQASDDTKGHQRTYQFIQDARDAERADPLALKGDLVAFIEDAVGLASPFAPQDHGHYHGLIQARVNDIFDDMVLTRFSGAELRKFLSLRNVDLRPMLSLRDVDKPGRIVPSNRDAGDNRKARPEQISRVMRFIRRGSGAAIDDDDTVED